MKTCINENPTMFLQKRILMCRPCRDSVFFENLHPALTRWANIFRPICGLALWFACTFLLTGW